MIDNMVSTEIVWVYGASAAGKETFIHQVGGNSPELLEEFGWQHKCIGVCDESLQWVARFPGDTIAAQKRPELFKLLPLLAQKYDVVLVKGQDIDLALGTPLAVKQRMPQATHRIIFIDVALDELFQRVVHKSWWDDVTKRAEEEGWLKEQIDRLQDIRSQFDFVTINGNASGHYEKKSSKTILHSTDV